MTSKELLYEWGCGKAGNGERKLSFGQINDGIRTYFEEMEVQPVLAEYAVKNKSDMEKYMEKYFDDDLTEIKTVCIRAFLEGILKIEDEDEFEKKTIQSNTGIKEYIYNF